MRNKTKMIFIFFPDLSFPNCEEVSLPPQKKEKKERKDENMSEDKTKRK